MIKFCEKNTILNESAFNVSDKTIADTTKLILMSPTGKRFLSKYKLGELGLPNFLKRLNAEAVAGRYKEEPDYTLYKLSEPSKDKAQLLKSADTYMYQISEDPVYNSPVYNDLKAIIDKEALEVVKIDWRKTPEYENAKWNR